MTSRITIEIDETKLKQIIGTWLSNQGFDISAENLDVQVKSKQNYKAEWESAAFRVIGVRSLT